MLVHITLKFYACKKRKGDKPGYSEWVYITHRQSLPVIVAKVFICSEGDIRR